MVPRRHRRVVGALGTATPHPGNGAACGPRRHHPRVARRRSRLPPDGGGRGPTRDPMDEAVAPRRARRSNDTMSEISERYARLADAFAEKVAAVRDDQWDSPTPCEGWTARDLVQHMIDTQGMFLGFVGRELGDIPTVEDDPLGAWNAARAVVQGDLDDPERAGTEFDGFFGRSRFDAGVDRFLCFDLVVHG